MCRSARRTGTIEDYLYFDDVEGLLACVQMGTIEFHGWGSQVDDVEKPDRMVFDLDPDVGLDFDKVKAGRGAAARRCSPTSASPAFPLLSGGKGVHVVVPLDARTPNGRRSRTSPSASPRHRRSRARDVHRQHPQGQAQGPHLPRLSAQPARRDRGPALFGARARRRAGRRADHLGGARQASTGGNHFSIRDAEELLDRASAKMLAGWGVATQALPNA